MAETVVEAARAQRRGRGRPSGSNGSETRDRILHAAREVFSEVGFESATFKDIAERAGVTRTNVNHYFHSKDELYQTLFESTRDSVVAVGLGEAALEGSLVERLSAFLRTAVQVDSYDRSLARFIAASLFDSFRNPEFRDRALGQLDDVRAFIMSSLEDAVAEGAVPRDADLAAITEMLIAVMWGMSMYAGFVGDHEQLEAVVDQFVNLLAGALW
ncbi:TetR/AcrR family transcriptional regulator [Nocardia sp. NPDC004711]